jgi:hypothetical protein
MGYWGWTQNEGVLRILLSAVLPLVAAVTWGVFRVNGDPGKAPIAVNGIVRFLIEVLFFSVAVVALIFSDQRIAALIFAFTVVVHYLVSYDRVIVLLQNKTKI